METKAIHFLPQFVDQIKDGSKTQTARTGLGKIKVGERLSVRIREGYSNWIDTGVVIEVAQVDTRELKTFTDKDAIREGFVDLDGFKTIWNKIHPRKGFVPSQRVDVIQFKVAAEEEKC